MSDEEITTGLEEEETFETAEDEVTEEVAEEQPEKFQETLDDVKKARAYQQAEAQAAKERAKQLEAEKSELYAQLDAVAGKYENATQRPGLSLETPKQGDSSADEDPDDPYVKKLNLLNQKIDRLAQSNEAAKQYEIAQKYNEELTAVGKVMTAIVTKGINEKQITEDQVREAYGYAVDAVPDYEYNSMIGKPSKRARIFRDRLRALELEAKFAQPTATRGTHADKAEAMNAASHPAGGAIPAPGKQEEKSFNEREADKIAPDDDFIPIPNS